MAGRVVDMLSWRARLRVLTSSVLLVSASACGSFNPASDTRYVLLNRENYAALQISDAHWVGYDDQHSATYACTNHAAGDHQPDQCSLLFKEKPFSWDGPCHRPPSALDDEELGDPGDDGLWVQGILRQQLGCKLGPDRCYPAPLDVANMWGAGVALMFSKEGKTPWSADAHHVRGVAFDFIGTDETRANLRVGIPTRLLDKTPVPSSRPLIRDDASVLAADGIIYGCDGSVTEHGAKPTTLADVRVDDQSSPLSSAQHTYGSSFWQLPTPLGDKVPDTWVVSPIEEGHNEFVWSQVLPPLPSQSDTSYSFEKSEILGIEFQVVHQTKPGKDILFAFQIKNLALLLE